FLDEDADTGHLRTQGVLSHVVINNFLLLIGREGNVVVKVEVAVQRGDPLEGPALIPGLSLQFLQWPARDGDERNIALFEMIDDAVEVVGPEGTAFAADLPFRPEHEV